MECIGTHLICGRSVVGDLHAERSSAVLRSILIGTTDWRDVSYVEM